MPTKVCLGQTDYTINPANNGNKITCQYCYYLLTTSLFPFTFFIKITEHCMYHCLVTILVCLTQLNIWPPKLENSFTPLVLLWSLSTNLLCYLDEKWLISALMFAVLAQLYSNEMLNLYGKAINTK